jgi:hypothetical protein
VTLHLRACFDSALYDEHRPEQLGFDARISLDPDGVVRLARVTARTTAGRSFEYCLNRAFLRVHFARGRAAPVTYLERIARRGATDVESLLARPVSCSPMFATSA